MSLGDVMGAAGLHWYAQVGMVLFMLAFGVVVTTTFLRRNQEAFERARRLPLEDEGNAPSTKESGRDG